MTASFVEATGMLQSYIRELNAKLGEIASGNFDISLDVDFKGDFLSIVSLLDASFPM